GMSATRSAWRTAAMSSSAAAWSNPAPGRPCWRTPTCSAPISDCRTMNMSQSQIVIVTGGSRGIGAATARLLGRGKAAVVVNYRNARAEADAVVNDIKASGGDAFAIQADVGNEDDVLHLFAETDRAFGPLTGLVNNAG